MRSIELLFGILIGVLLFTVILWLKKRYDQFLLHLRFKHGIDGEKKAKKFMENNGYEILEYQPELCYNILIDGEEYCVKITPDYLVKFDGKIYIAEVKTGDYAPSVYNKATRRQLLEYYFASEYDGVLLIDMEKGNISEVIFEHKEESEDRNSVYKTVIAILLTIIIFLAVILLK